LLVIADAIRDRLQHSALIINITGESYRGVKARKLALSLGEEFGGGLAKGVFEPHTKEMHMSGLGHAAREQRFGFGAVSGTGALADSLTVDDLVDVPDATAQEKSRRSSQPWRSSLPRLRVRACCVPEQITPRFISSQFASTARDKCGT
jgi:hypothetical protein